MYNTDNRITNRTLLITTPELENMGAYFLSEKVVFLTDPTSGVSYIELDRLWIEDTRLFFAPENTEKARILMERLQRDKLVRMRHNYTIRSLYGHDLLVTLKCSKGYKELSGRRYRPGRVYIQEGKMDFMTSINCKILDLYIAHETVKPVPYHEYYETPIELKSTVQVHTVEVKGKQSYPKPRVWGKNEYGGNWTPDNDMMTDHIKVHYDYEEKFIWTECNKTIYTGRRRRSGDDCNNEYIGYHAKGMRYFETRFEMSLFVNLPFTKFMKTHIMIKKHELCNETETKGCVHLYFFKPEKYRDLYEIMDLNIIGEYEYDWE